MNVYVETNFVLELALLQEQLASCREILRRCRTEQVQLLVPAISIAEAYETTVRRQRARRDLKRQLDFEMRELARTAEYATRTSDFQRLTALLTDSANEEAERLEEVRRELLEGAEILALDAATFRVATFYEAKHGLSARDALVFAAVKLHLGRHPGTVSCFVTRDSKDFDDPDLREELKQHGCKLLVRFDDACGYILGARDEPE